MRVSFFDNDDEDMKVWICNTECGVVLGLLDVYGVKKLSKCY